MSAILRNEDPNYQDGEPDRRRPNALSNESDVPLNEPELPSTDLHAPSNDLEERSV